MKPVIENICMEINGLIDKLSEMEDAEALMALESVKLKLLITLVKMKENKILGSRYESTNGCNG